MAILDAIGLRGYALAALIFLAASLVYLFQRPALPKNTPPLDVDAWPILGSRGFFTERWDWFSRAARRTSSGHFTFWAGQWPVIALSGEKGRKVFFEEKRLAFSEGYATLLGGGGSTTIEIEKSQQGGQAGFNNYFNRRMISVIRHERLARYLPKILQDARGMFDELAADPNKHTDVFESVYRMVFKFTMRTVACNEIADSPRMCWKTLRLFEILDTTSTAMSISFPWMPTPAKLRRFYYGAQLYKVVNDVVKARQAGKRDDDTLQYLVDEGDNTIDILTFILGALFAGQLNSGINSAYSVLHIVHHPTWLARAREEVHTVADRYAPDTSLSLPDRLMQVPAEAWEAEFPVIDVCLKETIRVATVGTAFRRNTSGEDIPLNKDGTEIIPKGAFATYAVGDVSYNADIFTEPKLWDPSRYDPDRAEDKKQTHAYIGWGAARHPCLGMRFAKMENNIIMAMFIAYFDNLQLVDGKGDKVDKVPEADRNRATAHKPKERVMLRYDVKKQKAAA